MLTPLGLLSACTYQHVDAPAAPAEVQKTVTDDKPLANNKGCIDESLKDDVRCKFVAVSVEAFAVEKGQPKKILQSNEYDEKGRLKSEIFSDPSDPNKYSATLTTQYSQTDGLKYFDEYKWDSDKDGKFDARKTVTYEYDQGKEKKETVLEFSIGPMGVEVQTGEKVTILDYSKPHQVWKTSLKDKLYIEMTAQIYDGEDIKTEKVLSYQSGSTGPKAYAETQYSYQSPGKLESQTRTQGEMVEISSGHFVYQINDKYDTFNSYDEAGRLTQTIQDQKNAIDVLVDSDKKIFTFDDRGNLASSHREYANSVKDETYKYDEFNNQIFVSTSGDINVSVNEQTTVYKRLYQVLGQDEPQVAVK